MMKQTTVVLFAATMLSACSTIMTGTSQGFTVITPEAEGANCDLLDSKGNKYYVRDTPNSATVTKGDGPMVVTCKKAGFKTETVTVEEGFAGATIGNILLGGGIGIIVDAASGAAQKYPSSVTVWMEPNSFKSSAARTQWQEKRAEHLSDVKSKEDTRTSVPNKKRR